MADNDHVNPEDDTAALEALIREHYEHEIEACEELADFSENALTPWGGRSIKKAAMLNRSLFEGMAVGPRSRPRNWPLWKSSSANMGSGHGPAMPTSKS